MNNQTSRDEAMSDKHEKMETEGVCPRCGLHDLDRDTVHNGVALLFGPYGCLCGWSEDPEYDLKFKGGTQKDGSFIDQFGGRTPKQRLPEPPTKDAG